LLDFALIHSQQSAIRPGKETMIQALLLAVGAIAGLALAYVDSLPRWDDTGILVGSLLLVSALLTALGYRRPWLMALAVGLWIPLREIYATHDARILAVLVVAFVGAHIGWAVRRGIQGATGTA
jgi:hypothetical protein